MQLYRYKHLLLPSWTLEELVELEETAQQHLFQPQQPNATKEYLLQPSTMFDKHVTELIIVFNMQIYKLKLEGNWYIIFVKAYKYIIIGHL